MPTAALVEPRSKWAPGIKSQFVEVRGTNMHYLECGQGDPVVFLHGNPTWSYLWRNVLPHVAGQGRCIAPDLIGMGLSGKPFIEYTFFDQVTYLDEFVCKLGLSNVTFVLHDWGSALGFYYAYRNPDKIKGLAFLEALFRPYERWSDFPAALRPQFQRFRSPEGYADIIDHNVFVEQVLPHSMFHKLTLEEFENYRRPFTLAEERKPILQFVRALPIEGVPADVVRAVSEYSRWLRNVTLPKLLITAQPGAIVTEADVHWCKLHFSRLTIESIGRSIHFYQEDNPEGVGLAIARWLSTRVRH